MSVESVTAGDGREYTVQVQGGISIEELQDALANLDPNIKVQSFSIGFKGSSETSIQLLPQGIEDDVEAVEGQIGEVDDEIEGESEGDGDDVEVDVGDDPSPEDLDPDKLKQYEYTTLQKAAPKAGIKGNQKHEQLISEFQEYFGESESETSFEGEGQSPPLRPGHDPFYLMAILNEGGQWMRTTEIRDAVQDDWDVNKETIGNTLWHLTERDLIETQKYEEDKRQKEYRITEEGSQVMEQMIDYIEEEELSVSV